MKECEECICDPHREDGKSTCGIRCFVHINDHEPNFYDGKKLYLVKCFACNKVNYGPAVATGTCSWCGWTYKRDKE